jgi:hypothetical protein
VQKPDDGDEDIKHARVEGKIHHSKSNLIVVVFKKRVQELARCYVPVLDSTHRVTAHQHVLGLRGILTRSKPQGSSGERSCGPLLKLESYTACLGVKHGQCAVTRANSNVSAVRRPPKYMDHSNGTKLFKDSRDKILPRYFTFRNISSVHRWMMIFLLSTSTLFLESNSTDTKIPHAEHFRIIITDGDCRLKATITHKAGNTLINGAHFGFKLGRQRTQNGMPIE